MASTIEEILSMMEKVTEALLDRTSEKETY
jgi:hypothetical protein